MATEHSGFDHTLPASGDLSGNQFELVDISTSGQLQVVAARGGRAVGVLQDKSTAATNSSLYRFFGITKVEAGDSSAMENAINFGTPLISSSQGRAVPTTDGIGDILIGYGLGFLATGSTGVISMMVGGFGPSSSA